MAMKTRPRHSCLKVAWEDKQVDIPVAADVDLAAWLHDQHAVAEVHRDSAAGNRDFQVHKLPAHMAYAKSRL